MWYAFLRLSNPDKTQEEIYDFAVKNTDLEHIDDFIIYLVNALISKTKIERNREGKPISIDGKIMLHDNQIFFNCNIYEGNMKYGLPNGFGKMTNPKFKVSYEGEFINGNIDKNSIFKIYLPNGDIYEGDIKNGVSPSGRGKMMYQDKPSEEGIWKNGVLVEAMPIGGRRKTKTKQSRLKKRTLTKRTLTKRNKRKRKSMVTKHNR
jgi:hypothetical protein